MRKPNLKRRFVRIIKSKKIIAVVVALFIAQGAFFSASINYKIPSDEQYHFRLTELFTNQSVFKGPVIVDQGNNYYDLGDVERTPNILYHYLASIVLRILRLFTTDIYIQIFLLRMFNVLFGVFILLMVEKILKQIQASIFIKNCVVILFALTGMFLWGSSAISYDPPAMLMFFALILTSLKIIKNRLNTKSLLIFILLATTTLLLKASFAPFIILIFIWLVWEKRADIKSKKISQTLRLERVSNILIIAGTVTMLLLAVERFGLNLTRFGSIKVQCDQLHSIQNCLQNDVYKRNYYQKRYYEGQKIIGKTVDYNLIDFSGSWVKDMYERIYFYYGHEQMRANNGAKTTALVSAIIVLCALCLNRKKLLESSEEKFLAYISLTYVLIMYLFNTRTYLTIGERYAFQGRYLLPILPFVYYFGVKAIVLTYSKINGVVRNIYVGLVVILILLNVYMHLPLLVFYRGTEAKWYSEQTKGFHLKVQERLRVFNIKTVI